MPSSCHVCGESHVHAHLAHLVFLTAGRKKGAARRCSQNGPPRGHCSPVHPQARGEVRGGLLGRLGDATLSPRAQVFVHWVPANPGPALCPALAKGEGTSEVPSAGRSRHQTRGNLGRGGPTGAHGRRGSDGTEWPGGGGQCLLDRGGPWARGAVVEPLVGREHSRSRAKTPPRPVEGGAEAAKKPSRLCGSWGSPAWTLCLGPRVQCLSGLWFKEDPPPQGAPRGSFPRGGSFPRSHSVTYRPPPCWD